MPDPSVDPLVGQVLAGRFRVIRVIGRTAVGVLYEVQHEQTQRTLTLEKLAVPPPLKDDPGAFERFRHDADVVSRLHHPNIAELVEWQTLEDGSHCVATERPDGEDLTARTQKGVPPWSVVSSVAEQVLTALEAAHRAGVIHGALTPQHILLAREPAGRQRCKLYGFGVSRIWHLYPHPSFAEEREAAFYLSPEHAQGKTGELGPASDCFSFASILFELVTGKQPFSAASAGAIIYKIGHGRADTVLQHRADAPPGLDQVLARAWARDRERRLTAAALREELLAVLSSAQFLASGSTEIPLHSEAAPAPSTLLLPEPLPAAVPDEAPRRSILPAQLAALRQRRWLLPAAGGAAGLLLLVIVLIAHKGAPPPLPAPAPAAAAPATAAPTATAPPVAPPPEPAVAPPTSEAAIEDAPKQHRKHHHHHSSSSKTSSTTHKSKDTPKSTSKRTRKER